MKEGKSSSKNGVSEMPEGPEVKLSTETIKPLINDHIILAAEVTSNSRYSSRPPEGMTAFKESIQSQLTKVQNIQTKGKFMYWTFSNEWFMFSTFGMSGQWAPTRGKHPCLVFQHTSEMTSSQISEMVFNDPRHFGTIKFTSDAKELLKKIDELGWDPLSMDFDKNLKWITFQLSKADKPIAEVLMDQGVFAGVGNYIRAEALYLSKLSPWRRANKLNQDEIISLCKSIIAVMQESYQHQGATISTYKTAYGEEGKYSTLFKVYGQDKDPLGNKIIKQPTPDKRTIHWCPDIQK